MLINNRYLSTSKMIHILIELHLIVLSCLLPSALGGRFPYSPLHRPFSLLPLKLMFKTLALYVIFLDGQHPAEIFLIHKLSVLDLDLVTSPF